MENLFSNPLELKLYGMEWNWNGIGIEISPRMKSMQNGMEMEWNWNRNRKEISAQKKLRQNGMDME